MTIKLIALDLDGTTLNSKGQLTDRTRNAIESAAGKGVHIVIATGRAYTALPEAVFSLKGLRYAATSNGARVVELSSGEAVYCNFISKDAIRQTAALLRRYPFMLEVFIDGFAYVDRKIYDNLEAVGLAEKHAQYVKRTRKPRENLIDFMEANGDRVENININFGRQEDRRRMAEVLKQLTGVTLTSSFDHNLEIGGETTSKADALAHLCGILGIDGSEVMACGDSPNDEAMLRFTGFPVAMGNGKEQIKAVARYTTGTNDEDGVARAIEKFVLSASCDTGK